MIIIALVLSSFIVSYLLIDRMPGEMTSHWGLYGEADGSMSRGWVLFLLPSLTAVFSLLMVVLPYFDPLRANVEKFMGYYAGFIASFAAFMTYLHALTLAWNLGLQFNILQWLAPAFGGLMYSVGVLMEHSLRNWFIGVRTPWTISSDVVWAKTHKVAGRLFKVSGVICLLGVIAPRYFIILLLASVLPSSIYTVLYSYIEYRKEKR